jgi:threonine dehydrogenase-like Zn-dependent dehydrogenase
LVTAAVRTGPGHMAIEEFERPQVGADDAIMAVLVAGVCGTDAKMYREPDAIQPVIMGHENVGLIVAAGDEFAARSGSGVGDLVFVEHYVPDLACEWCRIGEYRHCTATDWRNNSQSRRFGYTSAENPPHLWGGFAQYMYLPWNAVVHKVPKGMPPVVAGLATPLSNGIEWSLVDGGVEVGSSVLIQGPGQQGLSQVVACKQAGASTIIVTGTDRDSRRLEVATSLGADVVIDVTTEDALESIMRATGGRGVDVVVDCTSAVSSQPLMLALDALKRRGGRIIIQGNLKTVSDFPLERVATKAVRLQGARGHSFRSCELALGLLASQRFPMDLLTTHEFGLSEAGAAIDAVAGLGPADAIHVSVLPWGEETDRLWNESNER